MNARKMAAGEQSNTAFEQAFDAIASLAANPAAENESAPPAYFFQRLDELGPYGRVSHGQWPTGCVPVPGRDLSRMETGLYGLSALLELLQAEASAAEAEDHGHIHAAGRLGGNVEERLHFAARFIADELFRSISRVSEDASVEVRRGAA